MPAPSAAANASPNPQLAASILQAVASHAQSSATPTAATQTLTAPIHVITNPPSFQSFLRSHRAAVAFFTDANCGPCRMIEPVFERLSEEKGAKVSGSGVGFAKIDIGVGLGNKLASEWGIRATPTFIFFLDGKKVCRSNISWHFLIILQLDEMKGANANELRSQIDLLAFQAFPRQSISVLCSSDLTCSMQHIPIRRFYSPQSKPCLLIPYCLPKCLP